MHYERLSHTTGRHFANRQGKRTTSSSSGMLSLEVGSLPRIDVPNWGIEVVWASDDYASLAAYQARSLGPYATKAPFCYTFLPNLPPTLSFHVGTLAAAWSLRFDGPETFIGVRQTLPRTLLTVVFPARCGDFTAGCGDSDKSCCHTFISLLPVPSDCSR
jgi:hypothetical protein